MTWHMYQDMGMCGCLKFVGLTALWKAIRGSYGLVEGRKGSSHGDERGIWRATGRTAGAEEWPSRDQVRSADRQRDSPDDDPATSGTPEDFRPTDGDLCTARPHPTARPQPFGYPTTS